MKTKKFTLQTPSAFNHIEGISYPKDKTSGEKLI